MLGRLNPWKKLCQMCFPFSKSDRFSAANSGVPLRIFSMVLKPAELMPFLDRLNKKSLIFYVQNVYDWNKWKSCSCFSLSLFLSFPFLSHLPPLCCCVSPKGSLWISNLAPVKMFLRHSIFRPTNNIRSIFYIKVTNLLVKIYITREKTGRHFHCPRASFDILTFFFISSSPHFSLASLLCTRFLFIDV